MSFFLFFAFISLGLCSAVPLPSFEILDVLRDSNLGHVVVKVHSLSTSKQYAMKVPSYLKSGNKLPDSFVQELATLKDLDRVLTDPEIRLSFALLSPDFQQPAKVDLKNLSKERSKYPISCLYRDGPVLLFPFYKGEDLQHVSNKPLSDSVRIELAIRIVRALQALHRTGYVHQYLNPATILLDSSRPIPGSDIGQPVLTFCGNAAKDGEKMKSMIRLSDYLAPEKASDHTVACNQDVFSLGLILRDLFYWQRKHYGDFFQNIIDRCCNKDPRVRPSLDEIIESLERLR